jgi:hypothetical protein
VADDDAWPASVVLSLQPQFAPPLADELADGEPHLVGPLDFVAPVTFPVELQRVSPWAERQGRSRTRGLATGALAALLVVLVLLSGWLAYSRFGVPGLTTAAPREVAAAPSQLRAAPTPAPTSPLMALTPMRALASAAAPTAMTSVPQAAASAPSAAMQTAAPLPAAPEARPEPRSRASVAAPGPRASAEAARMARREAQRQETERPVRSVEAGEVSAQVAQTRAWCTDMLQRASLQALTASEVALLLKECK